ncbi:transmembrane GTPase fzo1 [Fusarium circinatum]|uniref:Transmembrane GTPase fzo1 n=1 Tax=Fusarium circinatum TaxID=48490 RepID=A0A8H5TF46_FUSCI|nr:transmembrane GTPase fzo1 [Fusarium circinatum]
MDPNRPNNQSKGKVPMKSEHEEPTEEQTRNPQTFSQPYCMTVGNGPTSAHAAHLQAMIDSGYGSSTAGDEAADMAVLPDLPLLPQDGTGNGAHSQAQGTSIEQLWYERHRVVLGRSVNTAIHLLTTLQEINVRWSVFYPTSDQGQGGPKTLNPRPNFMRAQSAALPDTTMMYRDSPRMIRRSDTSYQDNVNAESSRMAEERGGTAPRLLASQLSPQLAVLNIDLKLGHLRQADLVHTLERTSIASLLDEKIRSAVSHLQSLRARIEDLSSKILITGDVNAGRSTFFNALLRRKVLSEDQQPCTAIFCEVLDAMENDNVEEVHAVHIDTTYNRRDEQTYDIYAFKHLADIVSDNTKYHQCKVYSPNLKGIFRACAFCIRQAVPLDDSRPRGSGDDGTPDGDDPNDDPKGKGKDLESIRDFDKLEESLRRFILEKRARSKLAPAKHYLLNILNDINILAAANSEIAQLELDKGLRTLQELEPQLKKMKDAILEVENKTGDIIETMHAEVYNSTRTILTEVITHAGDRIDHLDIPYPDISASVIKCEEHARVSAVKGVNMIKQLGLLHLGDEYQDLAFHPAAMFRRKRDELAKQIHISTEISDFVEWPVLFEGENLTNVDTALKLATAFGGGWIVIQTWMDQAFMAARVVGSINLRRAVLPGIICTGLFAVACIIWRIPTAHPRRISAKIAAKLAEIDYVHANATRISNSVRKVLGIPANNIRVDLDRAVKDVGERRDESLRVKAESNMALTYFRNLVQDGAKQKTAIEGLELEAYSQT